MVTASSSNDKLAKGIRRALLPPRFPDRRDVVINAEVMDKVGFVSFHDNLWLDQQRLAAAVVRIRGDGIEGALEATSFRQLLRAALALADNPESALSLCTGVSQPHALAAAVVTLDVSTGKVASATVGEGRVTIAAGAERPDSRLSAGDIVWLAAGDFPLPTSSSVPVDGLDRLVRPVIGSVAGCVAAVLFKAPARASKSVTFIVPNDPAEIPELLRKTAQLLSRQSIGEDQLEGVEVALDEVLTNSVNYAFSDGGSHEILVTVSVEPAQLVIEIRDDGSPFDPLSLPAPNLSSDIDEREVGGLGMHFVRSLLDEVSYQRKNGWNVLRLQKRLRRATHLQET